MNDELTTRLSRQLHEQVDGWSAAPLSLEQVQGKARSIRRRRQALTTGVVAAAVLAVAIPIGVSLGGSPDSSIQPAPAVPSEIVDSANPESSDGSPLGVPYVEGGALSLPTGEVVPLGGRVDGGAVVGATIFVLEGNRLVELDAEGGIAGSTRITEAGFATGPDRSAIAYVRADDGQLVVQDGAGTLTELGVQEGLVDPVAVVGTTVYFNRGDGSTGVASTGDVLGRPDAQELTDVSSEGLISVITSATQEAGACSAVMDGSTPVHESCDYTYGRFSPDGEHLSAHPSQQSGYGDQWVAILDASGAEVARWEQPRDGGIWWSTWEDPAHLLVTTYTYDQGWSIVRLGVDGTSETALGPDDTTDDFTPAFVVLGPSS